ncbi:DUF3861 domain-containing protein [Photobacterium rosenbergii]|uniref:DUF3861 domain-containing protein n=1 Tax=Photobacterium rosenbergii TaxID=294936 RepID=A0A2T3NF63_9GAMM|nr:DUF3861 domain-containing protein [Photobacterium rosenbergii]PSW13213.1 DUF3861 domain-containing protein [Photobacterium rosenbergii]
MKHNYRITIERTNEDNAATMQFEFEDREDMFAIVDAIKHGSGLDENDSTRLGVALRLLGPMMMKDRKHPLFAEFFPHFGTFMKGLKAKLKNKS